MLGTSVDVSGQQTRKMETCIGANLARSSDEL